VLSPPRWIREYPNSLTETTLAQCNSFLVLRLVNPRDKSFVRSVMENLSEADANILQSFGPGQGIVSGQAVRFPLLVKVDFDADLVSDAIGDEDFISDVAKWKPDPNRVANAETVARHFKAAPVKVSTITMTASAENKKPSKHASRRGRIRPKGF